MVARSPGLWLAIAAVAYVALGREPVHVPALVALPLLLAIVWRATQPDPDAVGEDAAPHTLGRGVAAGVAIALAGFATSRKGAMSPAVDLGAAIASLSALTAVQRSRGEGGLARLESRGASPIAPLVLALAWSVAFGLGAAASLAPERLAALPERTREAASTVSSLLACLLVVASAALVMRARHAELGIAERCRPIIGFGAAATSAAILLAALGLAQSERVLPLAALAVSAVAAFSTSTERPTELSRTVTALGLLVALLVPLAIAARHLGISTPERATPIALGLSALAAALGFGVPRLLHTRPSRWQRAARRATQAALTPDPAFAIESALSALVDEAGGRSRPPALILDPPGERIEVDRAGYVRRTTASLPARLLEIAGAEPHGVLRRSALEHALVRRSELRPLAEWLDDRAIACVVALRDAVGFTGAVVLPEIDHVDLGAAVELRQLADRLGAASAASAALNRSLEREASAHHTVRDLALVTEQLTDRVARGSEHLEAIARLLARPAEVASYSPAARSAVEQVQALGARRQTLALLVPPGVDATAWAATFHLASARRGAVLLVLDASSASREPVSWWADVAHSPLCAARGGTLIVHDAHLLPEDVQSYLATHLESETALCVSLPTTVDTLVADGRLSELLADRLGGDVVAIPPLVERAEDLRGLALEHLARLGRRLFGEPLGLEPAALSLLLEHDWPANDLELAGVLTRAALVAEGKSVGAADLRRAGLARALPAELDVASQARGARARRRA